MKHKIHNIVILGALLLASCTDLSVSRFSEEDPDMDEYTADAVFSLRAEQSPDNVVSMTFTYGGSENSAAKGIFLKADKPAESNLTVALASAGEDFVADYSESTGIGYTLLPAAFWRFSGGDMISLAAGASESPVNTLTIFAVNTLGNVLEPGRYLLPLVASSLTEELSDSTIFVDVNVVEPYTDPDGYELYTGEDMFTVFYINTSSFDPRLANDMAIGFFQDGTYEYYGIGNIVNLRTSSLEYDETTGKVSILPSADTRYVLEHYAERVLPVQESGRKVCICIEGGGQGIGFCNLDDSQIADFVSSVKRLVETYPIDGINLWDRNSGYDKAGENGFPAMNTTSYPKLIKAIREAIGPDKLLTVVDYEEPTEYFHDTQATGGIEVGTPVSMEPTLKYGPPPVWSLTSLEFGHRLAGSLTGVVASKRVTEAPKGALGPIGNRPVSVMAKGRLTARPTSRPGRKLEHSDPAVQDGMAVAQRIKGTPGITG